jgi:phosphoribosylcarboxyaminoimidazole (NCAIR) mutase
MPRATPSSTHAIQQETANAALTLAQAIAAQRHGTLVAAGEGLEDPREK